MKINITSDSEEIGNMINSYLIWKCVILTLITIISLFLFYLLLLLIFF